MKTFAPALLLACVLALPACGGGGGGASAPAAVAQVPQATAAQSQSGPVTDGIPVFVDSGPAGFFFTGKQAINTLYTSVTVCSPGQSDACETIDHVMVDTGSVGLRLMASALSGVASFQPITDAAAGSPLRECVQFADGYSWGSVRSADVKLAGVAVASLPINIVADAEAGPAPASCLSGPPKDTVSSLGANGVLGIGSFVQDCGTRCVGHATTGLYYTCPAGGDRSKCEPASVPLERQVKNPVAALEANNNGVTLDLSPVPRAGSKVASGTLYFGVGTTANNAADRATFFTVDRFGTLSTSYNGRSVPAVIDTGSNGYFFNDDAMTRCTKYKGFYCPTTAGAPTSSPQNAAIVGRNGLSQAVAFTVDNLDQLFSGQAALPGLAAPGSSFMGGAAGVFSWGLPFFYGRRVHILLDGHSIGGVTGPAIGF